MKYKWGIIGAGHIAEKFAQGLTYLQNAECYAVASRSLGKSEAFIANNNFSKAYGSYEELLADPEVDIVYIATPNTCHFDHVMMSLKAKKHVLCEKPFASNLEQAKLMFEEARRNDLFLMEALWSRFLPSMQMFKCLAESGKIGNVKLLQADFAFRAPYNPQSRLFDPELGGGSLPDIGIYPLFISLMLFGYPTSVKVISVEAPTGTDLTTAILLKHANNVVSMLVSSFDFESETQAVLSGEFGRLRLSNKFHMPTNLFCKMNGEKEEQVYFESVGNGYNYEAQEVMLCLDKGRHESKLLPHSFTLQLMTLIEEIQNQTKL